MRGLALQLGAQWVMAAALRYLSYAIDTALLAAAVTLSILLQQYPFVHAWLTAKVVLLAVYIVLGSFALKRGRTARTRLVCWIGALAVYALIVSIARSRDPLGWLRFLA